MIPVNAWHDSGSTAEQIIIILETFMFTIFSCSDNSALQYQYPTIADGLYEAGRAFESTTHAFVDRLSQVNRQKLVW